MLRRTSARAQAQFAGHGNMSSSTRVSPARPLAVPKIFNRQRKGLHKAQSDADACVLQKNCADQLVDRRAFIKRDTPVVLDVGCGPSWYLRKMIETQQFYGLKQYIQTDISEERLNKNWKEIKAMSPGLPPHVELVQICTDEEIGENPYSIPVHSVDQVVSCLGMHWVNDLEHAMVRIRRILKKDGFLMLSMFGGNTLFELRSSFALAQTEQMGGLSPFTSPLLDGAGMSTLMLQSGFTLPTIDMDRHILTYTSPFHLMEHLSDMGESASFVRAFPMSRSLACGMSAVYSSQYANEGRHPATFEIFNAIGWSPSPNQSQPAERGSAQISLKSLNSDEFKNLQKTLDAFSQDPTNVKLQQSAEDLYKKLIEQERQRLENMGMEFEERGSTNVSKDKHNPPFQPEGAEAAYDASGVRDRDAAAKKAEHQARKQREAPPDTPKVP